MAAALPAAAAVEAAAAAFRPMRVFRLSGAALLSVFGIAAIVVAGNSVVGFFTREWHPKWDIGPSFLKWFLEQPAESVAPVVLRDWSDMAPVTIGIWVAAAATPLVYYLLVGLAVGKDPRPGTVIPLFTPPAGVSPAGARYIVGMGYDSKTISAEIVGLAVRGFIRIVRQDATDYMLKRIGGSSDGLTEAEKYLTSVLFRGSSSVRVSPSNGVRLRIATEMFEKHLDKEFEGPVFTRNIWAVSLGIMISGVALVAVSYTHSGAADDPVSYVMGGLLVALALLNAVFFPLMKAPTALGREIMDRIAGFRMFIEAAEHERARVADRPALTPALFAANLPYAMALALVLDGAESFAGAGGAAIPSPADFDWYGQTSAFAHNDGFTGMLRSLGAAVAAALVDEDEFDDIVGPGR